VKIIWFLHNVDKESNENYPKISKFSRKLIGQNSRSIFVMDSLLVPIAEKLYPKWSNKIDYITFGKRSVKQYNESNVKLISILKNLKKNKNKNELILFCPTSGGEKYSHIFEAPKLSQFAISQNISLKIIISGDLSKFLNKNKKLKE